MSTENLPAGEQAEVVERLDTAAMRVVESREAFEKQRGELIQRVVDAHQAGIPNVKIAERIGLTEGAVRAILRKAQDQA
ncbi:helix-turn-helix DNA binding domain protein [Arthrobacter phage Timinator]|uniref:Helix-turn-helix DNA binding domain protein n=2 Tax=Marthavirus barretlemon TaxID=2560300 RepID=A0A386KNK3_9CAUD|nr:helix-turn-helix DNA binding domain protein [Arthrobacter phage Timinator]AYD86509.1 helix-turn-helix DNA binding domain protein [Arthrobacter phage LeeroyJ]